MTTADGKVRRKTNRVAASIVRSRRPVQHVGTGVAFESIAAAAAAFGVAKEEVSRVCTGRKFQTHGHRFRFTTAHAVNTAPKGVRDHQTGATYPSIAAAARAVPGMDRRDVTYDARAVCRFLGKPTRFEYIDKSRHDDPATRIARLACYVDADNTDTTDGVYPRLAALAQAHGVRSPAGARIWEHID
jgi:hypothetical protein